ncbi:MAG: FtsQ-type POTRA domain-containing protein [Ilumatobacter sp.]|uniref:cell division protein FtsQ/DivIB n=1 Tax=Ilumatobacter sp. TaxID=1967498 RepID=UPI003C72C083
MSRWRRKDKAREKVDVSTDQPEFSDVRIVKPDESKDIAAELSAAFSDSSRASGDGADPSEADTAPTSRTTIAIGADDDLPDARYLDQELAGEPVDDSGTVFIDDDGTGDAIAVKDATSQGIEPRLRQRRIGVRRAEGRRRLKWAAIIGTASVLIIGFLAILGSSLFSVSEIDVTGLQNADAAEVEAITSELLDQPVLLVDTDEAEERLEAIAFIEAARVRTDFPKSVSIELRERVPVATVQGTDGQFRILDADGRVLDVIGGQPVAFVLISGTNPLDLAEGQFASQGYASATSIVTKLTPAVRSRLVSMSVTPDGSDLRFVLSNEPGENIEVRLGVAITDDDQIERLVRLERQLDDVLGSDTTVIDVSTSESTTQ